MTTWILTGVEEIKMKCNTGIKISIKDADTGTEIEPFTMFKGDLLVLNDRKEDKE